MNTIDPELQMLSLLGQKTQDPQLPHLGIDLRDLSQGTPDEKIKRIAAQFEEMLIKTMLKDAFKKPDWLESQNDGENSEDINFRSFNDLSTLYMSQYIAESGGLGYQEIIEEQIRQKYLQFQNQPSTHLNLDQNIPANKNEFSLKQKIQSPVKGEISSEFGWRNDPIDGKRRFHNGIDIEIPSRTPVECFMSGQVSFSGYKKGIGRVVEVTHDNGYTSRYGHNSNLLVKAGDHVQAGTVIALSGSTGRSTGPHLHFEVQKNNLAINPLSLLAKKIV